jgi:hypothetical protein
MTPDGLLRGRKGILVVSEMLVQGRTLTPSSSATVAHHSTDVGGPQPDNLWEIRNIIGKRTIGGVVHYWVDWDLTRMLGFKLEGAREMIDQFET